MGLGGMCGDNTEVKIESPIKRLRCRQSPPDLFSNLVTEAPALVLMPKDYSSVNVPLPVHTFCCGLSILHESASRSGFFEASLEWKNSSLTVVCIDGGHGGDEVERRFSFFVKKGDGIAVSLS